MQEDPIRIAVVGSGPAGFYAAGHLLTGSDRAISIDMFDRLPTPWGLVRSGVAPDHPKIKAVTRVFEKTARHSRFRFFGHVELGKDITRQELLSRYHAVLYATGTPHARSLSIPGEDLQGSWSATAFVGWYNGHPDHVDHAFDLSCERAVVIGNGNVALDVARMLALPTAELERTDTSDHALRALAGSSIREVVVVGRRGAEQAAFTNPELRELGELADTDVVVDPEELERGLETPDESADTTAKRNVDLLRGYAERPGGGANRTLALRFLLSPLELRGEGGKVTSILFARNELQRDERGRLRAVPTGETEEIRCGLVLRAVGYQGDPIPDVPFDPVANVIPNEGGRVMGPEGPLRGEYVVGWIKRGPTGVIGTNKKDAQETVDALLEDLEAGQLNEPHLNVGEGIEVVLTARDHDLVTYQGWEAIDRHERGKGEPLGRPRVKLTRIGEMVQVASGES